MLKLKFNLRHQDIQLVNKGTVVATDSKDYLVAKFNTISDDWETPLTAVFTDDKHNQPYAVVVGTDERLAEDECFVPWEVLTDVANVYVSVYCGNLHTTVTAAFRVQKSGYVEGETPPPPSPTVYDTIIQALQDLDSGKQDKLTAGTNITIDENNRISAQGGSNNYNDLSNRPQIGFTGRRVTLENTLNFYFGDFTGQTLPSGVMISLRENVFKSVLSPTGYILYNFNVIASNLLLTGVYKIRKVDVTNLPQEFSNAGQILYVFHYLTNKTYSDLIRMVTYEMADGVKVWIQLATLGGTDESGNTLVNTSTAWTDLTNQIGYTLTEQDKQDIADIVIQRLQGGD